MVFIHPLFLRFMFRTLLFCLFLLAFAADASAQTPAPATVRRTIQQKTTTRRTTRKPRRTTMRKTSTNKVATTLPAVRPGAGATRERTAVATPGPASSKGQGVYAAPGEPVGVPNGATMGYDGAAPRRAKASTTLTPR